MKLTTKQLKQIIKEELQYLYEDEQGSVSDEEIANLFLIGKDDFETMQVLMEDLFGSMPYHIETIVPHQFIHTESTKFVTILTPEMPVRRIGIIFLKLKNQVIGIDK